MRKVSMIAAAGVLAAASSAMAAPVLQFDLNGFSVSIGGGSFGLNYSGTITFTKGTGVLNELLRLPNGIGGGSVSLGNGGTSLQSFTGSITFNNGQVSGGSLLVRNSLNQTYSTNISAGSGQIGSFIGGGFTVQAMTKQGFFSGANWGTISVADWFNVQGPAGGAGLPGSFLQFSFNPGGQSNATADMDLYVDVVPLPPAAWAGLATLAGVAVARRLRRR